MFFKKYKERKKEEKRQLTEEALNRRQLIIRINALKVELGIASWQADEDFYEELFTILKTMKDRLDSLEGK
jgi:hypothetical protein